ncbi:Zinc finger, GATA-type [Kalmanozyma brasiliensis GHG001]|uniref:GATA-type domain-containing protein n=1 Tax=Kalmanozyma brasiliensis (strain GHG001) TaxID=1365824 RepID=V5ECY5_KALBG|nr:Zinc finger, GATA-type [Kalmanozyma brasiliensis GHG001]EST08321.1 Zinc finger, GATA-type [Kalmanozyma brasiliensis GHG001]
MSASNPLINSPHAALGRHPDLPYANRPKRSDSIQFDHPAPRGVFGPAHAMMPDFSDEATFVPTTLAERLLERTYLDDVVQPLVRALVGARMVYGVNGEAPTERSQAYVDLEKLRRELERSTQRARHAEQERDDLARRLDLAGVPDAPRERAERHSEHLGPSDHITSSSRSQQHPPQPMMGVKRSRPGDYEPRPSAPGSNAVSVNVAHGDGPGASVTITTEAPHSTPVGMTSRPHHDQMSPPGSYSGHPGSSRHRSYADLHHDPHDGPDPRHSTRMPLGPPTHETDFAYADDRGDRYNGQPPHRPPLAPRYGARSPQSSSAYLTSSSDRSSMPTLTTYPSTSSSTSFTPAYSSVHYDHANEADDLERSRKVPRHDMDPPTHPVSRPGSFMLTPSSESSYPIRKLASTKNRTCSSCAAPHDAKFRRGPNGPGTLCDRCGSRWKKFKEQESASKRESMGGDSAASAAASAAAQARLSSASASSESPMEPPSGGSGREESAEGRRGPNVSPGDAARRESDDAQMQRERSASVDQLIDD